MLRYVIYDEDGNLLGCYLQVPPEEHLNNMIVVDEVIVMNWAAYRANAARDGIELIDPVDPEQTEP